MPITTANFWNDLNEAITDAETHPEYGDRDGVRQVTYIRLSRLLDHYSGLWRHIREDAAVDIVRHARLIHALMLRDAAGGHDLGGCNLLRVDTRGSLREVLNRAALDKVTMHRILDLVSDGFACKPILRLRHHTERPFNDEPPPRCQGDDIDDIPF